MTKPHRKDQSDVADTVDGEYLHGIFHRQVSRSVKGNQEKWRDAQYLPTDEHGFEIPRENNRGIAEKEEHQHREKALVARLTVQVPTTENPDQER